VPRYPRAMTAAAIRSAFPSWPAYNSRLRAAVAGLTGAQLAIRPSPERWPLWASIGHLACQRVFWLCDWAGAQGADTTRFTNAIYDCPGDDDLEHVLSGADLVEAIDATFRIVEACLETWTLESLAQTVSHSDWPGDWTHPRGFALERVFAHDVWHIGELSEALTGAGLAPIDLWS
jgi:DinB superfamily